MIKATKQQILERIRPRLMSTEYQGAKLEELVKKHISADVWLTWYADLNGIVPKDKIPECGYVTAPVTHDVAAFFGLTIQDLLQAGYENTKGRYTLQPMAGVLTALGGNGYPVTECDEMLYVITNAESHYGAVAALDPEIQKGLKEQFGTKFYLLPSSLHEMICIAADGSKDQAHELARLVHTINHDENVMRPQDILSDHIFCIEDSSLSVVV